MAITPGLQLPYGIQPTNPLPVDSLSGPFTGGSTAAAVAAANAAISPALRFQSMEVRLVVGGLAYKYWYYDGTGDGNLVQMQTASIGGGISGDYVQSIEGLTGVVGISAGANVSISTIGSDIVISSVGTVGATGATGATGPQGATGVAGGIPADYVESLNGRTGQIVLGSDTYLIYNTGGALTGSSSLTYNGILFGISGDVEITGRLIVNGVVITKTGFQGFTGDSDEEFVEGVIFDGGDY